MTCSLPAVSKVCIAEALPAFTSSLPGTDGCYQLDASQGWFTGYSACAMHSDISVWYNDMIVWKPSLSLLQYSCYTLWYSAFEVLVGARSGAFHGDSKV